MSVAIHPDTALEQQAQTKAPLEIGASDYWFQTLRPYMENMLMTCRTDEELIRTIEKDINTIDSVIVREEYPRIIGEKNDPGVLVPLMNVLSSPQYYTTGPLRHSTEKEKEVVRGLIEKVNDFALILQFEKVPEKQESKTRERLGYSPTGDGNGFNSDHAVRNMASLNKPNPRQRIPNV